VKVNLLARRYCVPPFYQGPKDRAKFHSVNKASLLKKEKGRRNVAEYRLIRALKLADLSHAQHNADGTRVGVPALLRFEIARYNRGRHRAIQRTMTRGGQMILTCPSNASWVKRSPFIRTEHGLGPLRVSFIVRQVEQPLGGASIQPPLCPFSHYVPRTRLWKRFSSSRRHRRPARRFPGDLRAARNPERFLMY